MATRKTSTLTFCIEPGLKETARQNPRKDRKLLTGKRLFIEVKERASGAATVTVTKNEVLCSLNKPDDFILAIVEFLDADAHRVHYVRRPFQREPDFGVASVNYRLCDLIEKVETPR